MDRKLKERLIGLVVLLTVAIVILPMILGGPDDAGRSVSLERPQADDDLPVTRLDLREREDAREDATDRERGEAEPRQASEEQESPVIRGLDEQETEPSEPEASDRDAQARPQPESEPATEPEPDPEPDAEPEPDPEPEADADQQEGVLSSVPSGSGWTAQVGSFSNRDNADRLVSTLRDDGFQSFLMRHEREGEVLYRVRVGLEPDREKAQRIADRIRERTGHPASPVPHP